MAGLALALFSFLLTYDWGAADPDQLSAGEALRTAAAVYVMVFVVLKLFSVIIQKIRD